MVGWTFTGASCNYKGSVTHRLKQRSKAAAFHFKQIKGLYKIILDNQTCRKYAFLYKQMHLMFKIKRRHDHQKQEGTEGIEAGGSCDYN